MSSTLYEKYTWHAIVFRDGSPQDGIGITVRDSGGVWTNSFTTNSDGRIDEVLVSARYDISSSVSKTDYSPYTICIASYKFRIVAGEISLVSERTDKFGLEFDSFISEQDESVVSGYSGISIDKSSKLITVTENHTLSELYDYCKHSHVSSPDMDNPGGILVTEDGKKFTSPYSLKIDGCVLSDDIGGAIIDIGSNDLTLVNGGDTDVIVKSSSGTRTFITVTVIDLSTGGSIEGARVFVEDSSSNALMNTLTDSTGKARAVYLHTEDVDVYGRVRKGSSEPYYKPAKFSGKIRETGLDSTVLMAKDE